MDGWGDGREAKKGLVHENDRGLASVDSMISLSSTPNLSLSLLFISVASFFVSLFASRKTKFGSENVRPDILLLINKWC